MPNFLMKAHFLQLKWKGKISFVINSSFCYTLFISYKTKMHFSSVFRNVPGPNSYFDDQAELLNLQTEQPEQQGCGSGLRLTGSGLRLTGSGV